MGEFRVLVSHVLTDDTTLLAHLNGAEWDWDDTGAS